VFVLIGTMLVDMIGFGIVLPLLPFYAVEFGAGDWMVGPLIASFSFAQLLSTPFWGKISDHYGRRPLILAGLAFSAVSYVLFGLATTVAVLFISRIVQGASGGTIAVAQAYVADTTAPEKRAQVLGWLSAATGAAFMVGPAIGSWAFQWGGHRAPGFVAAGLCLVNLVLALRFLPEPKVQRAANAAASLSVPPLSEVMRTAMREPINIMIAIYFLGIGAFTSITAIFPLFLNQRFGIDETNVGYVFVYVGMVSMLVRGITVGPLVRRLGETGVARIGGVSLGVGLVIAAFTDDWVSLAFALTFIAGGTGTLFPPLAALISRSTAPEVQGSTLGINQFFGGVARVVGPLWGAAAFDFSGASAPFFTASAGVALAFLLTLKLRQPAPTMMEAAGAAAPSGPD
jgi:multidrug resistance protein